MANIHKLEELCRELIATIYTERHNERMRVDGYWDDMTKRMEEEQVELNDRLTAALAEDAPGDLLAVSKMLLYYYDAFRDKSPKGPTEVEDIAAAKRAIA